MHVTYISGFTILNSLQHTVATPLKKWGLQAPSFRPEPTALSTYVSYPCLCVCVCMYTYMYIHTFTCVYVYIYCKYAHEKMRPTSPFVSQRAYIRICVYKYASLCTLNIAYIRICVYKYAFIYVCMHTSTHSCMYVYLCVCVYIYKLIRLLEPWKSEATIHTATCKIITNLTAR